MTTARHIPRIMIAGTGSGCGKTTVSCALMGALSKRGSVRGFKCGPDYIDPMFHTRVLGVPSRNLDVYLCGGKGVRRILSRNTPPGATALIEGVMGFYDGIRDGSRASSRHLSRITGTPVILVASCRGKALSLAAELKGFAGFAKNLIAGVILNGVKEESLGYYRAIVEGRAGLPLLGCLPTLPEAELKSRHLGLVTAGEVADLKEKMKLLAERASRSIDLEKVAAIADSAPELRVDETEYPTARAGERVRIAVARDEAFCFFYEDNLTLLEDLGAELIYFSPLRDVELPADIGGIILPGGYPELYAEELAANVRMRESVRAAVTTGVPTIGECGGYMYLGTSLYTLDGMSYPMTGALREVFHMTGKLGRFGYQELAAKTDSMLFRTGEKVRAHEFHYSRADGEGCDMSAHKPGRSGEFSCGRVSETLYAGYQHLHFAGNPVPAERFVEACAAYSRGQRP